MSLSDKYDPNSQIQRAELEKFCSSHPLVRKIRANPTLREIFQHPIYRVVRTLELSYPYVCTTSFVEEFNKRVRKENPFYSIPTHFYQFEPTLLEANYARARIEEFNEKSGKRVRNIYSANEITYQLIDLTHGNQALLAKPRSEGSSEDETFIIPRAYYDALLHICAHMLWKHDDIGPYRHGREGPELK